MKKGIFVWMLLTGYISSVYSQINESDTVRFQFKAGITGNYQKGNVDLLTLRSRIEFSVMPVHSMVFKSQNSSLYQSFGGRKADNDLFSRNYLYFQPQRRLYPFAISYISANYRRKIRLRYFAGAGATVQLIRKPAHSLKASLSTVYEETRFRGNQFNDALYSGNEKIDVWRATLYVAGSHQLLQRRLRIYYDAYWQPVWGYSPNNRTQFDIGFEVPLWKGLSASLLYSYTREAVVIQGVRPEDRILSFGVSVKY
jgi:hypothetical protein